MIAMPAPGSNPDSSPPTILAVQSDPPSTIKAPAPSEMMEAFDGSSGTNPLAARLVDEAWRPMLAMPAPGSNADSRLPTELAFSSAPSPRIGTTTGSTIQRDQALDKMRASVYLFEESVCRHLLRTPVTGANEPNPPSFIAIHTAEPPRDGRQRTRPAAIRGRIAGVDDIIMKRSEFHNYVIVGRIGRMGTAFGPIAPADEQNSAGHNQGRPGVSVWCLPWWCLARYCSSAARMRTCAHFPIWAYMAVYGFVEKAAFCRN